MDDAELLSGYAKRGSTEAFADLVRRHVDMVYTAGRRQVTDPGLAEDVTQAVFILLAKKAGKIRPGHLAGWLMRTTHLVCRDALKVRARRRFHERQAAALRLESLAGSENSEAEPSWERYSSVIDEALAELSQADRLAVTLRYFKGMNCRVIGLAMGLSEEAAQKRIVRAMERLRRTMAKRTAVPAAGALGATISAHGIQAAPPALAASAIGAGAGSSISTTSAAAIAKGVTMMIAFSKLKMAALVCLALLALAGIGALTAIHWAASGSAASSAPGNVAAAPPADIPDAAVLQEWVETAFQHNFRDITARKTLEWGTPQRTDEGNFAIGYKYEATVWDKDFMIDNAVFTFTPEGNLISRTEVKGYPVKTGTAPASPAVAEDEMETALHGWIEKFFTQNYRDITSRQSIEWGSPVKLNTGNWQISYKYRARIGSQDPIVQTELFIFTPNGTFVSSGPPPVTTSPADVRVYAPQKPVSAFPTSEDLSSPEAAYATIERAIATGTDTQEFWVACTEAGLAERMRDAPWTSKPRPNARRLDARVDEVRIFRQLRAVVIAWRDDQHVYDMRYFVLEDGRWMNSGNDMGTDLNGLRERFARDYEQAAAKQSATMP